MIRRRNRRTEARELLREALDTAHRTGAAPLADYAETELRATGSATPRAAHRTRVAPRERATGRRARPRRPHEPRNRKDALRHRAHGRGGTSPASFGSSRSTRESSSRPHWKRTLHRPDGVLLSLSIRLIATYASRDGRRSAAASAHGVGFGVAGRCPRRLVKPRLRCVLDPKSIRSRRRSSVRRSRAFGKAFGRAIDLAHLTSRRTPGYRPEPGSVKAAAPRARACARRRRTRRCRRLASHA
jgi:hypothetical protein